MAPTTANAPTAQSFRMSTVLSIFLIIFGVLAIALPGMVSIGVVFMIAWLLLFSGVFQLLHAFQSRGVGHIVWKLLIAACYLVTGVYLLVHPVVGTAGLTFVLAAFFLVQGVVEIVSYLSLRKAGVSGWMLTNGIIALMLGLMIWRHWPGSSLWVIGTLTGVGMLMMGMTRLFMTLAVRKLITAEGGSPTQHRRAA